MAFSPNKSRENPWEYFRSLSIVFLDYWQQQKPQNLRRRQGVTWLAIVEACALDPLAPGTSLDIDMFSKVSPGTYQLLQDIKCGKRPRAQDRFKDVENKMPELTFSANRTL